MSAFSSILHKENTGLRTRLIIHGAGIILMAAVFWVFISAVEVSRIESRESDNEIQKYLDLSKMDFGDPADRLLFRESLDVFYAGQTQRNDSVVTAIDNLRQRQFSDPHDPRQRILADRLHQRGLAQNDPALRAEFFDGVLTIRIPRAVRVPVRESVAAVA